MRITSALWVAATVRRYNDAGIPAVLQSRGAEEAGAIFIVVDRLDGTSDLYGPAPQAMFDEAHPNERSFQKLLDRQPGFEIAARLERERKFDPDLWIVAIDDRDGRCFFDVLT